MSVRPLDTEKASLLRSSAFSYEFVGALSTGSAPAGFNELRRSTQLNRRDFAAATQDLLTWRMHSRAGLKVHASDSPLVVGTVVLMRWGAGTLSLKIPCRVVSVIDEPRRQGFAYGTLTGHPEAGEEQFVLEHREDGGIKFTIVAFSRPASTSAKLAGPVGLFAQRYMTHRYLAALDQL